MSRKLLFVVLLLVAVPCLGADDEKKACSFAGVWYGGGGVAYEMAITPTGEEGVYSVTWYQGFWDQTSIQTHWSGRFRTVGKRLEGSALMLTTADRQYWGEPPFTSLTDLVVIWSKLELTKDCNRLRVTIPWFGVYLADSIWKPGAPDFTGKRPLVDPPDFQLIQGEPMVEYYQRIPDRLDPDNLP